MSRKNKFGEGKKRGVYTMAGVAAAGLIGTAVIVNSNRIGVSFDPDKYTNEAIAAGKIAFDSVVYSNGSDLTDTDSVSRENPESEHRDDETLKENENREIGEEIPAEGMLTVGRVTDSGSDASAVDAVYGTGTGKNSAPVVTDNRSGTLVSGLEAPGGTSGAGTGTSLDNPSANNDGNNIPASEGSNMNNNNPSEDNRKSVSPQGSPAPAIKPTAAPVSKPTAAPTKRPSGGSGGSGSTPSQQQPESSNPSNSTDVAPVQKPNTNHGGSTGSSSGSHGDYSGKPVSMHYTGSFMDLCVGQSIESVFSPYFNRAIYLKFEKGDMVLKDSETTASGFSIKGLDTKNERTSATASASFTYNTKHYNINIDYSVSQWSLGLHLFDGSTAVSAMIPDENLRIDLSRYYNAFKRLNPNFCGWRDAGSDEIYTTECIMTKPDMQLYPCLSMDVPDKNDVGEEYEIKDVTDADVSNWNVYESCKVLTISGSVKNINTAGIAEKFPNLEEIRVDETNTVYTSVDGVLYKGDMLMFVPPAKKSISEYKDGVAAISENAFEKVKAEEIKLPETVKELSEGAFRNAEIETLEITAEKYHISDNAFYSDTDIPSVKMIVSRTLYVPDFDSNAFCFGKSAPVISVPDSMYDRAYQYYMSTWGVEIDKLMGEGTASKLLITKSGAETRNSLVNGAVYSFFDSPEKLTLSSVYCDIKGSFACDPRTVKIAADAFTGCSGITDLVIPEGTVSLEDGCFNGLTGLSSITFKGAPPKVDNTFFEMLKDGITAEQLKIYVPAESYDDYISKWGGNIDSICGEGTSDRVIDMDNDSYETIDGARYLRDENGLVLIRVMSSAAKDFVPAPGTYKIMAGAFETSLDSAIIPDTVTEIEEGAMEGTIGRLFINSSSILDVSGIKSGMIFVPASVQEEYLSKYPEIHSAAESYSPDESGIIRTDNALLYVPDSYKGELEIADDIELIYDGAANNCTGISKIILGSGVRKIGEDAFYNCRSLSEVDMTKAESLSDIGEGAFYTCVTLGELAMPASLDNIGSNAFYGCDKLKAVTLADASSIKAIGSRAFYGCNSLTGFNGTDGIKLGDLSSLEELGTEVFASSPLITSASLPPALDEIPEGLFCGCINLGNIDDWGESVIIGERAFANTALNSVNLYHSQIQEIRAGAFADCVNLDTIIAGDDLKVINSDFAEDGAKIILALGGYLPDLEGTDGDALIKSGKIYKKIYALNVNSERTKQIFGEEAVDVHGDSYISDDENGDLYALQNNQLTLIKAGTKTKNFDMSDYATVTGICPEAFDECDSMVTAIIDRSVNEIPAYAFDGCEKLESMELRKGKAASKNSITVGEYAFRNCVSLKNIELTQDIGTVGNGVFKNCTALKDVYWGATGSAIPEDAFAGCTSLEKIRLSLITASSVKEIGDRCFKDCENLTDVMGFNNILFSSLTSIGDNAFENCASLETLNLPDSVSSVGSEAFSGCDKLELITVNSGPFSIGSLVFGPDPGKSYFFLGEADEETYNKYLEFWRKTLDDDYGEGAAEKLVKAQLKPAPSPVPTQEPVPAPSPDSGEEPEPSETPEPAKEPEPADEPEPSKEPASTELPEASQKPLPAPSPDSGEKPEPAKEPKPSEEPAKNEQVEDAVAKEEQINTQATEGDKASE
ncbi:MAG: leucine-rich repeat protein [Clostridia bacterium]|nr:leucine-rich repeat protein [Clostridia bacterium]